MDCVLKVCYTCFEWENANFLNLPLWANFYNHTDLSHVTSTIPLDQLTLFMTSTLNQASPAAQVEAG